MLTHSLVVIQPARTLLFASPTLSQFFAITAPRPTSALKIRICISLKNVLSLHSRKGGIIHTGNVSFVLS